MNYIRKYFNDFLIPPHVTCNIFHKIFKYGTVPYSIIGNISFFNLYVCSFLKLLTDRY